jgi:predicted transposase/invertase (TIGR01784 family)
MENQLTEKIIKFEEENKMPYVTSWEKIGKKIGEKEGVKKGVEKEKFETARRMLNEDFPIETIIKCTELTEEEIKSLMN